MTTSVLANPVLLSLSHARTLNEAAAVFSLARERHDTRAAARLLLDAVKESNPLFASVLATDIEKQNWAGIAQFLREDLPTDAWDKIVATSAWQNHVTRFADAQTVTEALKKRLAAIKETAITQRTAQLQKMGVPNAEEVAKVEAKMGFRLNLDPRAIQARAEELSKFVVKLKFQIPPAFHRLPENQRDGAIKIAEALRYLNTPFRVTSNPYGQVFEKLVMETPALAPIRDYYIRFGGVFNPFRFDPQNRARTYGFLPGMEQITRPVSGGAYPVGMTEKEFRKHVRKGSKADREMRVIFRFDKMGKLVAIPYSWAFAEWLQPAAQKLNEAAEFFEKDLPALATYLRKVATAFLTNDFESVDRMWTTLKPEDLGPFDMSIGAVEQYVDAMRGHLAQLTGLLGLRDPEIEAALKKFTDAFSGFEEALPIPAAQKIPKHLRKAPRLSVIHSLYGAGDHLGGPMIMQAFNQTNDPRIRDALGFRVFAMTDVTEGQFNLPAFQPSLVLILEKSQRALVTKRAYRLFLLFHELGHGNGIEHVIGNPNQSAKEALGEIGGPIDEFWADVVGLYNAHTAMHEKLISEQELNEIYVSYVHRNIGILRRGLRGMHQRSCLAILKFLLEQKAITINADGTTTVHLNKMHTAVGKLVRLVADIKGRGDIGRAHALYEKYGSVIPGAWKAIHEKLAKYPLDIMPSYEAIEAFLGVSDT